MVEFPAATESDVKLAEDMATRSVASRLHNSRLQSLFGKKPRIILGSASTSRKKLLDEAALEHGFKFEVRRADIDEKAISGQGADPSSLVLTLGRYKAAKIFQELVTTNNIEDLSNTFLVTGDQVVVFQGCVREKPEDVEQVCMIFAVLVLPDAGWHSLALLC